jgi:hypothetical protein
VDDADVPRLFPSVIIDPNMIGRGGDVVRHLRREPSQFVGFERLTSAGNVGLFWDVPKR